MPDIKALIAAADTVSVQFVKDFPDATFRLIAEMRDALEAAQQAPAVDREALITALRAEEHGPMSDHDPRDGSCRSCPWPVFMLPPEDIADSVIASGVLQDAAEVEARGLERLIERVTEPRLVQVFGGEKFVSVALLVSEARAQQVREGNA